MPTGIYIRTEKHLKQLRDNQRKISGARKGCKRPPFSEEWKRNLSKSHMGKKVSEEQKKKISETLKGHPFWGGMSGKHHTEETKRKMRLVHKGIKLSEETKKKLSNVLKGIHTSPRTEFKKGNIPHNTGKKRPNLSGEKHWNWNGGITQLTKGIRQSLEYKNWRKSVFERDNYTCQVCGKRGVYLEVNHKIPFSVILYEEGIGNIEDAIKSKRLFDIDNGETLCVECHFLTPTYRTKMLIRDEDGKFRSIFKLC